MTILPLDYYLCIHILLLIPEFRYATNGLIAFLIKINDTSNGAFNATFNQHNLKTANVFVDTIVPVIELSLGKNSVKDLDGNVGDQIEINNIGMLILDLV